MADEPKIISMKSKLNLMTGKNKWTTKYDDGTIYENEYPTFIEKCRLCWKLVDSRKSKCFCDAVCCSDCKKECEKKCSCQLK